MKNFVTSIRNRSIIASGTVLGTCNTNKLLIDESTLVVVMISRVAVYSRKAVSILKKRKAA